MTIKYQKYGFKNIKEFRRNIEKLYGQGLSQQEIASQIGCSRPTLLKAFKEFNIKKTNRNALYFKCKFISEIEMVEKFKELYNKGLSLREIAVHYSASKLSIVKCFRKHGIETRSNSESIGILQKDVILDEHECELVYGMLLGNGLLRRKKYTAFLRYTCWNKEAIEFLAQELSRLEASNQYRKSQDCMTQFLEDCTEKDEKGDIPARQLYETWVEWCGEVGEDPVNHVWFGAELSARDIPKSRRAKGYVYPGYRLKVFASPETEVS